MRSRTRALAVLLLAIVGWTTCVWFSNRSNSRTESSLPCEMVIDLNEATPAELNLLPGVGEKLADDILRYRDEKGGFQSIDDLKNIRGIKEARLASLKKYITVSRKQAIEK
jgi:competence protein ComEA